MRMSDYMTGRTILLAALFAFCIALSSAQQCNNLERIVRESVQKLAVANNELAFNLHRKFIAESSENVFFSPFSISSGFGMLYHGARGETRDELRNVLGYQKAHLPDDLVYGIFVLFLSEVLRNEDFYSENVLSSANTLVVSDHYEIFQKYLKNMEDHFNATVRIVDVLSDGAKVVNEINSWVSEKTNGKIENVLGELEPSTVMVLLNAVYFKGVWKKEFNPRHTKEMTFFNNGKESEGNEVPFMSMKAHLLYTAGKKFHAVELPYIENNICMLILLPYANDGLAALEESMTPEKLSWVLRNLSKTKLTVKLPKFNLQFSKELSEAFWELGARKIFHAVEADFSGMTSTKNLFISEMLHKAVIEVDEVGSEAAAVTRIKESRSMFEEFKVDHPFLFAIIERGSTSNLILFLGRVTNL